MFSRRIRKAFHQKIISKSKMWSTLYIYSLQGKHFLLPCWSTDRKKMRGKRRIFDPDLKGILTKTTSTSLTVFCGRLFKVVVSFTGFRRLPPLELQFHMFCRSKSSREKADEPVIYRAPLAFLYCPDFLVCFRNRGSRKIS